MAVLVVKGAAASSKSDDSFVAARVALATTEALTMKSVTMESMSATVIAALMSVSAMYK